jgi:hypothetical protein
MNDLAERVVDRDLPTVLDAQGSRCPLTAARVADAPRPGRCWLADDAGAPRAGSIGPGPSLAGKPDRRASRPDRRPSRPVVSPTYAQGSYYGTNRVVANASGHLTSPAAPLLSTTRAAQPSGRNRCRSRSSVVRTGRVFRKNRPRGRGGAGAGAGERPGVTRRHLGVYLDELVFRSNRRHNLVVAFGTLLGLGAMWEPTTHDMITRARDIPRIICTPTAEADRQAAAAQQAPSAGHDISYFPGGNRIGIPRG